MNDKEERINEYVRKKKVWVKEKSETLKQHRLIRKREKNREDCTKKKRRRKKEEREQHGK